MSISKFQRGIKSFGRDYFKIKETEFNRKLLDLNLIFLWYVQFNNNNDWYLRLMSSIRQLRVSGSELIKERMILLKIERINPIQHASVPYTTRINLRILYNKKFIELTPSYRWTCTVQVVWTNWQFRLNCSEIWK